MLKPNYWKIAVKLNVPVRYLSLDYKLSWSHRERNSMPGLFAAKYTLKRNLTLGFSSFYLIPSSLSLSLQQCSCHGTWVFQHYHIQNLMHLWTKRNSLFLVVVLVLGVYVQGSRTSFQNGLKIIVPEGLLAPLVANGAHASQCGAYL